MFETTNRSKCVEGNKEKLKKLKHYFNNVESKHLRVCVAIVLKDCWDGRTKQTDARERERERALHIRLGWEVCMHGNEEKLKKRTNG